MRSLLRLSAMPRSASDATRFTATLPHAYSKPVSSSARLSAPASTQPGHKAKSSKRPGPAGVASSGPPDETPAQKVARLRAAHAARRAAEISTFDRIVDRGRAIADTAHKVTVAGIVGLSVICVTVVIYSFFDLHRHNKQKRNEWLENEYKMLEEKLVEARRAELDGRATDDQILLLNRERAKAQAEAEKSQRSVTAAVKGLFSTSGLKKEDTNEALWAEGDTINKPAIDTAAPAGSVVTAIQQSRRQGEKVIQESRAQGGLLDDMADKAVKQVAQDAKSWSSWLGFGSR